MILRNAARRLRGLYAITPNWEDDERLTTAAAAAIDGGAVALQYRNTTADDQTAVRQARRLAAVCKNRGVLFIVNNNASVAERAGADGVHLGKQDTSVAVCRRQWEDMLIGATCHDSTEDAQAAQQAGADYVAFGAMFASITKPAATPCPLSRLAAAKQKITLPIVAIGGITVDNAATVIRAGADAVAVANGLFNTADGDEVRRRARRFTALFNAATH